MNHKLHTALRPLAWACTSLALAAATLAPAAAQGIPAAYAEVALPFYTPVHLSAGLTSQWYNANAAAFAGSAQALVEGWQQYCAGQGSIGAVQQRWRAAATDWERLSAVALGPLVERRSMRLLDFQPLRPAAVRKAIATAPTDLRGMERVGAPAKGFPALEWLLWTEPAAPNTPACSYALMAAREVQSEAQALQQAFTRLAQTPWDEEDSTAAPTLMAEFINQWIGGLERLRWAQMEKPVRSQGKSAAPDFARSASQTSLQSWRAQWAALQALAVHRAGAVPVPGKDIVPIELYLRGRGLNDLAQQWVDAVQAADQAMAQLASTDSEAVLKAVRALNQVKQQMQDQVAPALEVNIGFSDADGD
ncbi:imelysin family protein [Comamonas endophytica]|uniref:Imelysin family protein n=1 Tax=Comamonas endophytica TaxID=2949090 RepID=A0ABY6G9S7_9BURK|nr:MULTISPECIES: imelysin family protein [unclassified Acidovorax]MCD2511786.1 imelysin family protein [Acidovorax sp. D4N7]UYG51510.1 imelysin family protein [Acidovorax sp. 5MLIR]